MPKHIYIWKGEDQLWYISLQNSPIMGDHVWAHNTWYECVLHANVLTLVWNHL